MDERIRQGYLFDFYGELLNEHQREIYSAYIFDDLSLGEIADERGVSRQSIFDLIKRCTRTLEDYENRLHLIARFLKIRTDVQQIQSLCESDGPALDSLRRIRDLSDHLLEEL